MLLIPSRRQTQHMQSIVARALCHAARPPYAEGMDDIDMNLLGALDLLLAEESVVGTCSVRR